MLLRLAGRWTRRGHAGQRTFRGQACRSTSSRLVPPLHWEQTRRCVTTHLLATLEAGDLSFVAATCKDPSAGNSKAMWKLQPEQGLSEARAALQAADEEAGFADSMPAWTPLIDALSAAVAADGAAQQAVRAAQQQPASSSGAGGADCAELLLGADAAVEQVLLWGQTAAAAQAAWAAPTADGEHLSIF
jgi:hypothetical protein